MVNFFSGRQLALLLALFTEWMSFDVAVTDSFPGPAVSFVGRRVAFVLVVLFVHDLLMLGTVLLTHGEPTATGVGTGTLGFVRHWFTSLSGHTKSHRRISPGVASAYTFYTTSIPCLAKTSTLIYSPLSLTTTFVKAQSRIR